jgi:metallo-beta-lactamase family protein
VRAGIFLTHGDDQAREVLSEHLVAEGVAADRIFLPGLDESVTLRVDEKPSIRHEQPSRVAPADMTRDWDNDYAAFLLTLGNKLEGMDDPDAQRALLAKLRAALNG